MDYTEKVIRHVNRYDGIIVDVDVNMVRLPNDAVTLREVVHHPGGVCIAAVDVDSSVAVVHQFRFPFAEHLLELPAGKLEKGEDPLAAAKRELSEETGFEADEWQDLGVLYTSPGFSTERLYLYLATGLHRGVAHPDANEFLEVESIPLDDLRKLALNGSIQDAKTVAGILKAAAILGD